MRQAERAEARLAPASNVLVSPPSAVAEALRGVFFGSVVPPADLADAAPSLAGKTVYLGGDVSGLGGLGAAARVFVVRELATGFGGDRNWPVVGLGRVPVRVHGVGVYYRQFFDPGVDHFGRIRAEHAFQPLTESTKPGTARRTGVYLTPVERAGDALHFRLLRCSTNLSGPTENFRDTDRRVVGALNEEAAFVFRDHAPLNHVLAQVYHNTPAGAGAKQAKARISAHADKTKDMPAAGVMAFCTFYDRLDGLSPLAEDPFDYGHKGVSGLTRLQFRLKGPAVSDSGRPLPEQFTLTLYPNSVFLMPLSTNRLYTHETRPPPLDAERLPTRLGYVVRCSTAEAVHAGGRTYLKAGGRLVELEPPTPEGMAELRRLYAAENKTQAVVDYGDRFRFSMNAGDYRAPRV